MRSLCRIGLGANNPAFIRQVERLSQALAAKGKTEEANVLERLIATREQTLEMTPSRLTLSRTSPMWEALPRNVTPPVDRETGANLADVIFPEDIAAKMPVFEPIVGDAIAFFLEELAHSERLLRAGEKPPRSLLLYGAPGTGKTTAALAIAKEIHLPVVSARLDGLISSFLGTTARNIANLFAFANRYRVVLLLDEFDAIAKLRDDPQEIGEIKRVVNTLIQNLDARAAHGLTMAITNHQRLLDPAIWRRFDMAIEVTMPSSAARAEIIRRYFNGDTLTAPEVKFATWITDGMSGGEIETMAQRVKRLLLMRDEFRLVDAVRQFSTTRSGASTERLQRFSQDSIDSLVRLVASDSSSDLTQAEIGEIVGKNPSTISRLVRSAAA